MQRRIISLLGHVARVVGLCVRASDGGCHSLLVVPYSSFSPSYHVVYYFCSRGLIRYLLFRIYHGRAGLCSITFRIGSLAFVCEFRRQPRCCPPASIFFCSVHRMSVMNGRCVPTVVWLRRMTSSPGMCFSKYQTYGGKQNIEDFFPRDDSSIESS